MSEIKRYELYCLKSDISKPDAQADIGGGWVRYADHLAAVEAAVMAEREAAARIVEFMKIFDGYQSIACCQLIAHAAKAIRARTTTPAKETP